MKKLIKVLKRLFKKKGKKMDLIDQFNAHDVSRGGKYTFSHSTRENKVDSRIFRGYSFTSSDVSAALVFLLVLFLGMVISFFYLKNHS